MYKILTVKPDNVDVIERTDPDGTVWYIPFDEANSDYQAYLLWLEEQA